MKPDARHYNCLRCYRQVVICSYCDRGNIYCGQECAREARLDTFKRSSRRYQQSRKGRQANALRQRRYRERQRQKVTQQTSPAKPTNALLLVQQDRTELFVERPSLYSSNSFINCHFCQCECSVYLRLDYLTTWSTRRRSS